MSLKNISSDLATLGGNRKAYV